VSVPGKSLRSTRVYSPCPPAGGATEEDTDSEQEDQPIMGPVPGAVGFVETQPSPPHTHTHTHTPTHPHTHTHTRQPLVHLNSCDPGGFPG